MRSDVVVITEVVADEGSEVTERACEAQVAIGKLKFLCFGKAFVRGVIAFGLPRFVVVAVFGDG